MTAVIANGFVVKQPGMLSLIQDAGRFGQHHLGLTEGGPADKNAFDWCHRLLENVNNETAIEVSIGGLILQSHCHTTGCITGANNVVKKNGKVLPLWQTFEIVPNDVIEFGYATTGVRNYFSVAGGFQMQPQFGSCATVVREGIGGINGKALTAGDNLATMSNKNKRVCSLAKSKQPEYLDAVQLRIVLGYQLDWFTNHQVQRFLNASYEVSKQWDRMGYRLSGAKISANKTAMYSEGIALGSVQIPADGQPIILLHDRQTIGGYPKIGTVLSLDLDRLTQCRQGAKITFESISIEQAHNALHLAKFNFENTSVVKANDVAGS
ncbi:biotin-dependent carboxyltransferase family protein [Psychrosphaera sp. 1_MG-2023]|uniref:Biotin-dependent carboxyltransferase family protein n=1 Tax=Psychrosphaera algicola TaxID=3023714 RepID=A0ABT5FIF5_9GAMM|nr:MULTISPECIES: biotin-dependent carboxyltransferase family protein [unclassified Psychrosphaera]MDC2890985.1 biotin-dependent carboxyltransferase family protein [Psychrosphaera sp. G1-22]MDO6718748.1 biotin-dependent carboxyltransferase family protein [Psychrosphaera sp. 1_MG-2023]